MKSYVPLHVHSHYSLLEGADSPETLLGAAVALGYATLALTDTNNLYGAVSFVEAARKVGIRPILGAHLRHDGLHCTALIAEPKGYTSLCRILSRLHLQENPNFVELLMGNAAGLHIMADDVKLAEHLRDAFGSRLWLELVRPSSSAKQRQLLEDGQQLGLRLVASTAAHFAVSQNHNVYRLLTAVRQGRLLDQVPNDLPIQSGHSLADPDAIYQRFRDVPETLVNAERLAGQCRSDVLLRGPILPPARVPGAHDGASYLRLLCKRGLARRPLFDSEAAKVRMAHELNLIQQRDLAGYFLVVRDIAREARRRNYGIALRGSAGNSLICYLLGITDIDPLRFRLPIERFLHAGRPDLPDIDLDFDWKIRDSIIETVFQRYGHEHTAMISSHLFLQPASAFRESAKAHGLSNEQVSRLLETLSNRVGALREDESALAKSPRSFPLEPERWPRLLADARRLLDRPHHLSIHPGGIVITPGPIEDYAPLQRAAKGTIIMQYDKDAAEAVGLVKIDLLGNRALSTMNEARRQIQSHATVRKGFPPTDDKTVALLQSGNTLGVNQLESPAMRHLLVQMQPRGLDDVIQSLALIRPGAANIGAKERFVRRRRGVEPVQHFHPRLESLLNDTCGLMLYEDDALYVVQALTGLTAPEADHFRKRISKSQSTESLEALSGEFLRACMNNGVAREMAETVWVQLAKFNAYSFCKSHAVSYGLIAWEAACQKAHHPREFWTAALNNNQGMYPRRVYIEAIKRAGIRVRLPCINHSQLDFSLETEGIRTGFSAIGSLNQEIIESILEDRRRRGPYPTFEDFLHRIHAGPEAIARLIQVGAFDCFGSRPAMMLEAEIENAPGVERELFAKPPSSWQPNDYSRIQQWREEWAGLGFLVGPPLMQLFRPGLPAGLNDSRHIATHVGRPIRFAGLVAAARHAPTKRGETMQFVTLEDEWGLAEVTLFPGTCRPVAYLKMGPYLTTGRIEEQYGVRTVTATNFQGEG